MPRDNKRRGVEHKRRNAGSVLMDSRAACDYSSGVIAVNIWLATSTRLPRAVDQPKRGSRGCRQVVS